MTAKTIQWYPLIDLKIPKSAKVLHVGMRPARHSNEKPIEAVWCEVDPEDDQWQPVTAVPTGNYVPDGLKHIGSVVGIEGFMVFHFYIKA